MSDTVKWRALLVLGFMVYAVLFEQSWPWGILFALWLWPSIREGHLVLGDDLFREDDPALFWSSSLFILSLCAWLVLSDLLPLMELL
ncbi:MAG: hypothetical protein HEP70_02190 [Rhodobiaceae bacterium]|nr:hypothetical protein [Rhodobiaceae bacterium]